MIPPRDDIDRLMAVMAVAFDPAYGEAWTRRQVEDALLIGNCHYWLVGGSIPGTAAESAQDLPAAGFALSRAGVDEEELLLLAVVPEARRQGIGAHLLRQFELDARGRGATRLLLEMRRGNPAESLYRRFGFSPIGTRPSYYRLPGGQTLDAITFAHDLR